MRSQTLKRVILVCSIFIPQLAVSGSLSAGPADATQNVVIENDFLRFEIGADGQNVTFTDKKSGKDYCDTSASTHFASIKKEGQSFPSTSASCRAGFLQLEFGASEVRTIMKVHIEPHYFILEVLSVEGEGVDELTIIDTALSLTGNLEEPFAGCALALNLQTNVTEIPGPNARLRAHCYQRFGFEGAKVAIIGCPQKGLRDVMKEVVSSAEELPPSNIGGPWALDGEINRGSYLFDFGDVTEETVDEWIDFVKMLGLNQIDFHTGKSLRFGDYAPNPEFFPRGRESVKAVIDKLHAAGIAAGLHTYAFFISKETPYVSPVPDPRLGKDATFTLAEALTEDATTVPVIESTEDMSTTTGFFVRNSVTLQIDDELIIYAGVSKEPPYAFSDCTRGALGTTVSAHEEGARVHHLKECFGLFTPDGDSTLLTEIAKNTADTFNECGFDMIYLDALDGEGILEGWQTSWHYGSKFVFEIAKRLEKPALFEMSTFHHHLWYVRARMGAWDHPSRSHKRFVDVHQAANRSGAGMFLPMNLGWWAVKTWDEGAFTSQLEPTFADDIEYLMSKCLGADMGISLMGVNPKNFPKIPAYQRLAPIFKQYEELRHSKYFPESIKEQIRIPGKEFTLEQREDGEWQFRPIEYAKHKVQGIDGWSNEWVVQNSFAEQPAALRIEALLSAAPYDSTESLIVADFSDPSIFQESQFQQDVTAEVTALPEDLTKGEGTGMFLGLSNRVEPVGAWAKLGKVFDPTLNLKETQAVGVWVHGDGQGELLNFQLRSPEHTVHRGVGDHYVSVDFEGWRYFELIEPEAHQVQEHAWPYGGGYSIYREMVDYSQVETLSLWYNRLPTGKQVKCSLSPIKALPLKEIKLVNPKVLINGKTLVFPTEIESGCYLEFQSMDDCKLYGRKGELLKEMTPLGEAPSLAAGENSVEFQSEVPSGLSARARVTVISKGEALSE